MMYQQPTQQLLHQGLEVVIMASREILFDPALGYE
jgi:hypothetical protein